MDFQEAVDAADASENAPEADLAPEVTEPPLGAPDTGEQVGDEGPAIPSHFTVKVGGEELQVSLEEALAGYQRNADYTQKTQALAAEREQLSHAEQLWQAIENNPQTTITAIAEAYGYKLSPAQEAELEAQREEVAVEDLDPVEQRLVKMEQFAEQARYERLQAQIDRELLDVHQKYGQKFDDNELLQYAVERQIGNLDDAFKAFAFERMTQLAADRRVQQRKETAPPVAGGHGAAAGAIAPGRSSHELMSVEEAFAAAEAAHSS